MTILEVLTLVSQSLSHIPGNNIASVFQRDWKWKLCLRNPIFWPLWGQNVGPCWVKNGKKGYFDTSHLTPNPVFPKTEVLKRHSLLAHKANKKINSLVSIKNYKSLFFSETKRQHQMKETCRLKVTSWYTKVVEPNCSKYQKELIRIL